MADISMCVVKNCPLKDKCYRKTAKPSTYQSYSDFEKYLDRENETCSEYYIPPYLEFEY